MDLDQFHKRINTIADTVERRASAITRKTAVTALQAVVLATPVGNTVLWGSQARRRARPGYVGGRARANWIVGINTQKTETIDHPDPSGGATIGAGSAEIDAALHVQAIHISNNLPYIVPLNNGHSHQAPVGFVELAVAAALNAVKAEKITEGK